MAANLFMKLFSNITDPQEYESRFFEASLPQKFKYFKTFFFLIR